VRKLSEERLGEKEPIFINVIHDDESHNGGHSHGTMRKLPHGLPGKTAIHHRNTQVAAGLPGREENSDGKDKETRTSEQ
jgi:hypothetical protein